MHKLSLWGAALVMAVTVGCGKDKEEALKGLDEIDALCNDNKTDEARKKGEDLYDGNDSFKKAVDDARKTWKITDVKTFQYCGAAMVQVRTSVENST